MTKLIKIFILFIVFNSCTDVKFETPQPENGSVLKKIPKKFIGEYKFHNDTLIIDRNYIIFPLVDFDSEVEKVITGNKKIYLSDSIILKCENQKYYLNIRSKNSLWDTYILKLSESNSLIVESTDNFKIDLMASDININQNSEREQDIIKLLDSLNFSKSEILFSKKYIISPTKTELKIMIDKGLFWDFLKLDRIK